jgi:hypothetical protein
MSLTRLRRFFVVTLLLVLPLQGQAVASMSCHLVQGAGLVSGTPLPAVNQAHAVNHSETAVQVSSADHSGHAHSHATPSNDQLILDGVDSELMPEGNTSTLLTESCALCATCCMLSAALPTHAASHSDLFKSPQPQLLPPALLAGVVPEGLLRPPR